MCGYCAKHWDSAPAIQLLRRWGDASDNSRSETYKEGDASGDGTFDTFDDLYYKARKNGAPVSAIATGADYGRQAWLKERGIELPGMLEKLVLSKVRMHSIIVKITANGRETHAERLTGHVLVFPHNVVVNDTTSGLMNAEKLRAAIRCVGVRFIGPKARGASSRRRRSRCATCMKKPATRALRMAT